MGLKFVNRWNIPDWLEIEVIDRDLFCLYCGIEFSPDKPSRRSMPSWEHVINDAKIVSRENIARCCIGCNASKGTKELTEWSKSTYCRTRGITADSVAAVIKAHLQLKTC